MIEGVLELWTDVSVTYDKIWSHYQKEFSPVLDKPKLILYFDPDDKQHGLWTGDEIRINFARTDEKSIVGTMIHEIWHCFQEGEADWVAERDLDLFLLKKL